jgi:hypothetical protein
VEVRTQFKMPYDVNVDQMGNPTWFCVSPIHQQCDYKLFLILEKFKGFHHYQSIWTIPSGIIQTFTERGDRKIAANESKIVWTINSGTANSIIARWIDTAGAHKETKNNDWFSFEDRHTDTADWE